MTTYLATGSIDGKLRHINIVVGAPDEDHARSLMKQAWPGIDPQAFPIESEVAQQLLRSANVQLGYPLQCRPKRRVTLVLDVEPDLTDNDIRKLFKPGAVIDITEAP